jgi:hypothetical protein
LLVRLSSFAYASASPPPQKKKKKNLVSFVLYTSFGTAGVVLSVILFNVLMKEK